MANISRTADVILSTEPTARNEYGDLLFCDAGGTEYKLSKQLSTLFSLIESNKGKPVKLGFAKSMRGTEYVAAVGMAEVPPKQTTPQPSGARISATPPISPQEKGMILKEVGDGFRSGIFKKAEHPELWDYYLGEIRRVLGVKI